MNPFGHCVILIGLKTNPAGTPEKKEWRAVSSLCHTASARLASGGGDGPSLCLTLGEFVLSSECGGECSRWIQNDAAACCPSPIELNIRVVFFIRDLQNIRALSNRPTNISGM